jgi:hypothetical protein
MMNSTKLLFHIRYLASPTTKYFFQLNSLQSQCFLHTSLPLMNQNMVKIYGIEEQPHMRVESTKRMYNEEQW